MDEQRQSVSLHRGEGGVATARVADSLVRMRGGSGRIPFDRVDETARLGCGDFGGGRFFSEIQRH